MPRALLICGSRVLAQRGPAHTQSAQNGQPRVLQAEAKRSPLINCHNGLSRTNILGLLSADSIGGLTKEVRLLLVFSVRIGVFAVLILFLAGAASISTIGSNAAQICDRPATTGPGFVFNQFANATLVPAL